jgi:hypothetical protein
MSEPAWALAPLETIDFTDMSFPHGLWQPTPAPADEPPLPASTDGPVFISLEQPEEPGKPGERLSSILSLIPVVGTVKDIVEGITGEDIITREKLSLRKRAFNFAAAAADIIGFGIAGRLAKAGTLAGRVIRGIHDGGKLIGLVNDAEDVYTIAKPGPL